MVVIVERDQEALSRVVAVINGKGGVLKTTLTANIGALLADMGWKILVLDIDPQGNLGMDLGYSETDLDDQGQAFATSLILDAPLNPAQTSRSNLWVVPGGAQLHMAAAGLTALGQKNGQQAKLALAKPLAAVMEQHDFDLVLIDCPPGNENLQVAALGAATWTLIPTHTDKASREGMKEVAARMQSVADVNPDIDLLGVVVTSTTTSATSVRARAREHIISAFGTEAVLFETTVRHSEATAEAMRDKGQVAHELETAVKNGPKWWQILRGEATTTAGPQSAGGVAQDCYEITQELVQRLSSAEEGEKA